MPLSTSLFVRATCVAALAAVVAPSQSPPPGFVYETLSVGGLDSVTAMAFLPDGRLLLTERETGRIRVFVDGALQATPWATIAVDGGGSYAEQGLLGIAVDPGFLTTGYVYVYYTDPSGNENRIARLRDAGGIGTAFTVLTPSGAIPAIQYHNSGAMVFGADGTLFVATGESLFGPHAQDLNDWRGKVLRFEVPDLTIPASNPFPNSPVWSYGHRNHFGFAVHPVTGDLYQTENGGGLMDELNRIVPGGNYGWPMVEGFETTPDPALVDPIACYGPPIAPTGMCFYSGSLYPDVLRNAWFFTDYNQGAVRVVALDATGVGVGAQIVFDDHPGAGFAVTMGPDGNLWFLANDNYGYGADELGRYVFQPGPWPGLNVMSVSNKTLGGSITVGIHGSAGGIGVGWLSLAVAPGPVPTPFGDLFVPLDVVLSAVWIGNDDRGYLAWPVPSDRTLLGSTIHAQGLHLDAAGQLLLTNATDFVVRG